MTETDENPVDQIVETFVYGPVGLAMEALTNWPKLVERGRSQVTLGRFVARTAAQRSEARFETVADRLVNDVAQVLVDVFGIDLSPEPERPAEPAPSARPIAATSFPIEGYDDLTAKEIQEELEGLDEAQLRLVRERETDGKARVTVIRRIDSLLGQ